MKISFCTMRRGMLTKTVISGVVDGKIGIDHLTIEVQKYNVENVRGLSNLTCTEKKNTIRMDG